MVEPKQYIGKLDGSIKFHAGQIKIVRDSLCNLIAIESRMVVPVGAEKIVNYKTEISVTLVKMIKVFCHSMNMEGGLSSLMHVIASGSKDIIKLTKGLMEIIKKENSKKLAQVLNCAMELQKHAIVLLQIAIRIYGQCGYKKSFALTIGDTLKKDGFAEQIYRNYHP